MDGSIALGRARRKRRLDLYRKDPNPCVCPRAHIVLLLSEGCAWSLVCVVLFCSTATVARWKRWFEAALLDKHVSGIDRLRYTGFALVCIDVDAHKG